jgi:hypothetical protein
MSLIFTLSTCIWRAPYTHEYHTPIPQYLTLKTIPFLCLVIYVCRGSFEGANSSTMWPHPRPPYFENVGTTRVFGYTFIHFRSINNPSCHLMDGIHHPGDQWLPFDCYPIWMNYYHCGWKISCAGGWFFLFFSFHFFSAILWCSWTGNHP